MNIIEYLQKQKLFIHYVTIITVIIGVITLTKMQREARPNVNFNRVNVSVAYPGASPSEIEELIIDPIEEKIAEVEGVKEYRSVSFTGAGSISIKIDDSYPEPSEIVDELRRKIGEVNGLPNEVDDPRITEAKASSRPVLNLALFGKTDPFTLKLEAEKLKDYLKAQKGIQSVSYSGISDLQLKIKPSPDKLEKYDITIQEVSGNVSNWAKQKPGGLFETKNQVNNITIGEDLNDLDSLKSFIVRSNDSGRRISLSDIAAIEFDLKSIQTSTLFEDKKAVLFSIVKKPFFDSIDVVDNLNKAINRYDTNLNEQLNIKVYKDLSIRIRNKLKIVITNALGGLLLVLLILLIFLDWRSAIVTSIGIPIAILGGFIVLSLLGQTINSLVVVGIIIVLGMLVDDAIVVCENIYSYIEKGLSPAKAALKGTKEIALPVIASILTTVFAFLPIVFMEGIIGQFLSVIPITVIALLSVSLIEALFVLPIHSEEIMKPKKKNKKNRFLFIENLYRKYINWSINYKWILLLILTLFLGVSAIQGKKIFEKFSLFPSNGLEGFSARIELDKNTPLDKTESHAINLSRKLLDISDGSFDTINSDVGQVRTGGSSGSRQQGAHLAQINVSFITEPGFIKKEKAIMKKVKKTISEYGKKNSIKTSVTIDRPGPPIGKPIQLQITSRDFEYGLQLVENIKSELKKINGVHSLETDVDGDSLKYRIKVDNELAVSEGVDPSDISQTIFASSTGNRVSEILKNNEKVDILILLDKTKGSNINDILKLKVRNKNAQAIPLSSFATILKENAPSAIQRFNGVKTITLFGEVNDQVITGKEANKKIRPYIKNLKEKNPTVKIVTGGGERDRMAALSNTIKLYGLALILIFMTISLTFRSVFYPFLVLTAIPMGIGGVIWSLVLHGESLTLMGIIGIVGLSGVVVNVSIIFLKFIQDRIKLGMPFKEAIIEAGVGRLRPIIMTTLSTLIGLLPTIYGIGGTDTFVQPIALVLGWGLFVATTLTLLFLPAIVSFFPFLGRQKLEQN